MKLLAIAALALILAGCGGSEPKGTFDEAGFKREVSSWDLVQGVVVSENSRSIWVGMMDDGTRRDGYAMSVCEAVREYTQGDVSNKTITILDGPKMSVLNERVELGKHRCKL